MTETDLQIVPYRIKRYRKKGAVEPAGIWYEVESHRRLYGTPTKSAEAPAAKTNGGPIVAEYECCIDEEYLVNLQPDDWKDQDHYRALGLTEARYRAGEDDIKKAYKKIVLLHHPDKRKGEQITGDKDDYFFCITKAWETLGDLSKRRAYDSVDHTFDDDIPSGKGVSADLFYSTFRPVFEMNARWSINLPVPELGTPDSSYDDVDHFYSFWYDFSSWREYSYLDEEDKEKGSDRYERKMIEADNRKMRQKRKKDEVARLRQLVDNAYNCDPRISKFKEEEKEKKAAAKREKQEQIKARALEKERKKAEEEEEVRKVKAAEEEVEKAKAQAAKKDKEQQKNAIKKEKKFFRNKLKEFNYFAGGEEEKLHNMQEMDRLLESMNLLSLKSINETFKTANTEESKKVFHKEVETMVEERKKEQERLLTEQMSKSKGASSDRQGDGRGQKQWTDEETQLVIKGVNLFPAGTSNRWEVVAQFIKQHVPESNRTAKEVLNRAKELQRMDEGQRKNANTAAFTQFTKTATKETPSASAAAEEHLNPSQRYMSPGETVLAETGTNPAPWSNEEQRLLEQALRTYPASTAQRWESIAECLPERSKKDCILRYKELAEMVKAKKLAALAAAKKK